MAGNYAELKVYIRYVFWVKGLYVFIDWLIYYYIDKTQRDGSYQKYCFAHKVHFCFSYGTKNSDYFPINFWTRIMEAYELAAR